jgi:hypothetical protein
MGAADAARIARERMRQLKEQFENTFDALRAELNKDTLGQAVAQIEAQYARAREELKATAGAAVASWLRGEDGLKEYIDTHKELESMQAQRIEQLREEARILSQRQFEDYQARLDAATPGNEREEAIAANARKLDREIEDLIRSFGPEIDERERATLAVARAATAAEKEAFARDQATSSLNAFTTAVKFAPSGFKLEPYIQQYAKGQPFPGSFPAPMGPFTPPMSPLSPTSPTLSRTGTVATAPVTITNLNVYTQATDGRAFTREFLDELDRTRNATGGINGSRSAALEVMKVPPRTNQWRS